MSHLTNNTHLLVYPFPISGHIIPLLDLTDLLLRRGITVTIVITTANLSLLDTLQSSHPTSLHKLHFPDPEPELEPEINRSSTHSLISRMIATRKLFDPIVKWFESHHSPPVAIVSDFFLGWTNDLALHLGIRRVVFSPSGAFGLSIIQSLWRDVAEIKAQYVDGDENYSICLSDIPNSPEFRLWQMSQLWRDYDKGDSGFEFFRDGMMANMKSWGVVYNTFEGMEKVYIDHVKKQMGHNRVWAVGPLLPDEHGLIGSAGRGGPSTVPPHDLLTWLDKKVDDSVVYICFGSRFTLSEKQMIVLASAIELSKVDFILCVKESGSSFIPSGFEDRMMGRGFIIKGWAPQLAILRHRALGSFVTHCGWNSTLEGVAAGVMMLTWPMGADQFANAMLLVDQLGVGKRVCEGGPEIVPDTNELARLLDESLGDYTSERVKVKELSREANKAVKEGTSISDLNMFVNLLSEL
ncbi:UDP-glycosyltransferase 89B2-like [Rutidosis leptorrhynchoides]|uniref:UDP-glycosyltransferase 89B2-like n=1 Tax=Rutidosis leptorrhynchoides TaxID=125765 RepID=UPI003A99FC7D